MAKNLTTIHETDQLEGAFRVGQHVYGRTSYGSSRENLYEVQGLKGDRAALVNLKNGKKITLPTFYLRPTDEVATEPEAPAAAPAEKDQLGSPVEAAPEEREPAPAAAPEHQVALTGAYAVAGRTGDGGTLYYTGIPGRKYLTADRAQAYRYDSLEAAEGIAMKFNAMKKLVLIREGGQFLAEPLAE